MGISREQALDCFKSDDLIGIGMEADAVRRRLHPEGVVTYLIDRSITCTEDIESINTEITDTLEMGGTGILLRSGSNPNLSLEWFEQLFRSIRERFPSVWLHGLTASEILAIANSSGLSLRDTLQRLHDAGLQSIPGEDAGILDNNLHPASTADWVSVHRTAHELGLGSTATLTFGTGETFEQRVSHFETIRQLQEETGGFTSFTPYAFRPQNPYDEATAVEYLKTLAISRMVLDNIRNIQSDWSTQGLKVLEMGLRFGGNDVGSVMLEKSRSQASTSEEDLRRIIRDAGFKPVQRDTLYRTMFLN